MILSPTTLSPVVRNTSFTRTITVTPEDGETINTISVTSSLPDTHITITVLDDTITISGLYFNGFYDVAKYVSKGSSNKIETPTVVTSLEALPPNKDLFDLSQDTANKTVTYTINVKYDSEAIDTETINHSIQAISSNPNILSTGTLILNSYFGS